MSFTVDPFDNYDEFDMQRKRSKSMKELGAELGVPDQSLLRQESLTPSEAERKRRESAEIVPQSTYLSQELFSLQRHTTPGSDGKRTTLTRILPDEQEERTFSSKQSMPDVNAGSNHLGHTGPWTTTDQRGNQRLRAKIGIKDVMMVRRQSMEMLDAMDAARIAHEEEEARKEQNRKAQDKEAARLALIQELHEMTDSEYSSDSEAPVKKKKFSLCFGEATWDACRRCRFKQVKWRAFMKTTKGLSPKGLVRAVFFYFVRDYFTRSKLLTNTIAFLAMFGLIVGCAEVQVLYENDNEPTWATYTLKGLVTLSTFPLVALVFLRWWIYHGFLRASNSLSPNSTLWNTPRLLIMCFLEMAVLSFHIPPLADFTVDIDGGTYPLDIFQCVMVVRLYLLTDVIRNFSGFFNTKMFTFGNLGGVPINTRYVVKVYIERKGLNIFLPFFLFVSLLVTFCIYLIESPVNSLYDKDFYHGYPTALYYMALTATYVGFGDVTPTTVAAQVLTMLFIAAVFLFETAMLTYVVRSTKLTFREYQHYWAIEYVTWLRARSDYAVNLIRRAWLAKLYRRVQADRVQYEAVKNKNMMSQILPDKLDAVFHGKSEVNVYQEREKFNMLKAHHPERASLDPNNYLQQIIVLSAREDMQDNLVTEVEFGLEACILKMADVSTKQKVRRAQHSQSQALLQKVMTRLPYFYSLLARQEQLAGIIHLDDVIKAAKDLGIDGADPSGFFKKWYDTAGRKGSEDSVSADAMFLTIQYWVKAEERRLAMAVNRMRDLVEFGQKMDLDRLEELKKFMMDVEDEEGMVKFEDFRQACVNAGLLLKFEDYSRIFSIAEEFHPVYNCYCANLDDLLAVCWDPKPPKEEHKKTKKKMTYDQMENFLNSKRQRKLEAVAMRAKTPRPMERSLGTGEDMTANVKAIIAKRKEELGIGKIEKIEVPDLPVAKRRPPSPRPAPVSAEASTVPAGKVV